MPPTRTVFWNSSVNIIRMPLIPFWHPHGKPWRNSGTLTSPKSTPSCRTAILISVLSQGFLQTCSVPAFSPWSSRSLPIQNGLPTLRRTIFMPSSPAFLSAILPEPALFTISSPACGFPMITISRPECIPKRKSPKSLRKKGRKHRLSKRSLSGSFLKNLSRNQHRI